MKCLNGWRGRFGPSEQETPTHHGLRAANAIEAMREPSDQMLKAGHVGEYNRPIGRYANIWHAMVHSALRE